MSFTKSDIDVAEFNKGDHDARTAIASCIEAFVEIAYAGIPKRNRFPVVAGTHTHTGRLEVNIAMPRAIINSQGKAVSFNPHPPVLGSRGDFDLVADMLNNEFGWDDPRDPYRKRKLRTADWVEKLAAEAGRSGTALERSISPLITLWSSVNWFRSEMETRDHLMQFLDTECADLGLLILDAGKSSITISDPETGKTIDIRGLLVEDQVGGSYPESIGRQRALARAADDINRAWKKRADWNSERYSKGLWKEQAPDFQRILHSPAIAISQQHPDLHPSGQPQARTRARGSRIVGYLLSAVKRLRGAILDAFASVTIARAITDALSGPVRNLQYEMERLNGTIKEHAKSDRRDHHARDDQDIDRLASAGDRHIWPGPDGRADYVIDQGIERGERVDGGTDTNAPGHGNQRRSASTDRSEAGHPFGELDRPGLISKMRRFKAAKRAINRVFRDEEARDIACFLIVPGEPNAISIRSCDWSIRVTRSGIYLTHGNILSETFELLWNGLIAEGIMQIDDKIDQQPQDEAPGLD
jgi:hypothetical protein